MNIKNINNQEIMMKKIQILLFFLLTAMAKPACGQPAITDRASDDDDVRSVNLYISGAMSLNPSCSDEKLGGGGVIDVEWQFSPWLGVGMDQRGRFSLITFSTGNSAQ